MTMTTMKDWLARSPLVAILRGIRPEEAEAICAALEENGVLIAEIRSTRPNRSTASRASRGVSAIAC